MILAEIPVGTVNLFLKISAVNWSMALKLRLLEKYR